MAQEELGVEGRGGEPWTGQLGRGGDGEER